MSTTSAPSDAQAIEAREVVKTFGTTRALDGLDLAWLSGRSTVSSGRTAPARPRPSACCSGCSAPTPAAVRLLGGDPWTDAVDLHRRLAYVPGDVSLWPKLSGGEIIDLLARLRGDVDERRRDELIERFELDPTKKARTYSKGNRQKVGLIAALASHVELLILDEPTSGLDPLMESVFQDCIHEAIDEGRTVLLSSHILAEVEALCDRVSIIRAGRTVETGTLAELRHVRRTSVVADLARPVDLASVDGVHDLAVDPTARGVRVTCSVDNERLDDIVHRLGTGTIEALTCSPPTLEELFLRHYGVAEMTGGEPDKSGVRV